MPFLGKTPSNGGAVLSCSGSTRAPRARFPARRPPCSAEWFRHNTHSTHYRPASGGVTLAYDPAGRLHEVDSSTTGTRFLYDGTDVIAEYDTNGNVLRRYVHGPGADEPLVWYEGSGTSDRRWLIADERGSVIGTTDGSGAVTQINKYDAYGVPDSANQGRFQYTGQMWIAELSLYHYKARAYHPRLGRFMQTDPIGFAGGANLYGYSGDDPVNLTDPSGLCALWDSTRWAVDDTGGIFTLIQHGLAECLREWGATFDSLFGGGTAEALDPPSGDGAAISCAFDAARAQAARSNPSDPTNLAPGTYPSKTAGFSAGYYLGVTLENRYVADFTTRTVHQLSNSGLQLGYKFGASAQWSGGAGNRNYTTTSGPDSLGFGLSGGASLIVGVGAAVNYDGSSWTRTTGIGLDVGFSGSAGFTRYEIAWPREGLPRSLSYVGDFYDATFLRECGGK